MASETKFSPKREISYFGPIYIKNIKASNNSIAASRKEVTSSPLDISKYKIQTLPGDTRVIDEINTENLQTIITASSSHLQAMPCDQIQDKSKHMALPNGESQRRKIPSINHVGSQSEDQIEWNVSDIDVRNVQDRHRNTVEDRDARNVEAAFEKFDEMLDSDEHYTVNEKCTFKISSTEDNYVFDKFKAKSKSDHNGNDRISTKTPAAAESVMSTLVDDKEAAKETCESFITSPVKRQSSNMSADLHEDERKEHSNGKDFLMKHRKRISKLKRRFFESQTTPKPIPIEKVLTESSNNAEKARHDISDDSVPAKPPRSFSNSEHFATESRASALKNIVQNNTERRRRHSADETLGSNDFQDMRVRWSTAPGEFAVVVAVDFGTTYSGYAFSFSHDPDTIHVMRRQESGDPGVYNQKIPTTILLTPDGTFHSFGYAARDFYHDLDQNESRTWMYFDRFKMLLHNNGALSQDTALTTVSGKEFSALKVFSYSLAYFKDLAIEEICDQSGLRLTCDVIRWIITVPAIWKASAKQFMRQAAYEAGIVAKDKPEHLLIALEPEVASIYCRRLRMFHILSTDEKSSRANTSDISWPSSLSLPELRMNDVSLVSNDLDVGTRYMVVDCGGGTVDITVHELLENGRLKEIHRASGGSHGSVGVDEAFERLLGRIFGFDIIHHYKLKRPAGWVDLISMFESRKRTASPYRSSHIAVSIPFSFIDFYKKCRGSSVSSAVKLYGDPEITWTSNGLLKLAPGVMRRLFVPTVDRIKQSIGSVLNNPQVTDISYMFLVGGFAESSIVQHEMRKDFGSLLKIIIPPGVGMIILRGAVCFGQDPTIVNSRCSCLTYGVGVLHRFDPSKHPDDKKIIKDGLVWCTDVFDTFVKANQSIELGESIVRRYTPVRRDQTATTINIYSTDNECAQYITDHGVSKCGTLTLALLNLEYNGGRREIRTEMMFGDTEIRVRALDVSGNHGVEASVDFINL